MQEGRHLIRRLREGDPDALRRIYLRYRSDLLTVATCLLNDPGAAEDVLHDLFVRVAGDPSRLNALRSLRRYLLTAVANRARDVLRQGARRNRLHGTDRVNPVDASPGANDDPAVLEALAELPVEQREVVTLHLHGEMSLRRIARHQHVSVNTAKSRYRYALDSLRSRLQPGAEP